MKNPSNYSVSSTKVCGLTAIVLMMAGCAGTRPVKYYQISAVPAPKTASGSPHSITLLVGRIECAPLLRDGGILYRTGTHEVNAYHYHRWLETPDRVVQDLLVQVLRASGRYNSVQEQGAAIGGDYLVRGKLIDFSEIDNSTIQVRVSLAIEVYNRKAGSTAWTHYYTRDEPVDGKDIQDVVRCLEHNLSNGLNEIATSLDQFFTHELEATSGIRNTLNGVRRGSY
jgi:ABC-type uncharacterized transport system auxiliary subunit